MPFRRCPWERRPVTFYLRQSTPHGSCAFRHCCAVLRPFPTVFVSAAFSRLLSFGSPLAEGPEFPPRNGMTLLPSRAIFWIWSFLLPATEILTPLSDSVKQGLLDGDGARIILPISLDWQPELEVRHYHGRTVSRKSGRNSRRRPR